MLLQLVEHPLALVEYPKVQIYLTYYYLLSFFVHLHKPGSRHLADYQYRLKKPEIV